MGRGAWGRVGGPPMSEYDRERRHPRFHVHDVTGSFAYAVQARVLNISLSGLAVETPTQLQVGRGYSFRLGRAQVSVLLEGHVVWCHLARTERRSGGDVIPVYRAGISFDDVLSDRAGELLDFMEKNVVLDLRRRVFGRFKLSERQEIVLHVKHRFLVKQLSVAGMLIQSPVAAQPESVFELEMVLDGRRLRLRGRIVYVQEAGAVEGTQQYRMGIEFIQPTAGQLAALEEFIREELEQAG